MAKGFKASNRAEVPLRYANHWMAKISLRSYVWLWQKTDITEIVEFHSFGMEVSSERLPRLERRLGSQNYRATLLIPLHCTVKPFHSTCYTSLPWSTTAWLPATHTPNENIKLFVMLLLFVSQMLFVANWMARGKKHTHKKSISTFHLACVCCESGEKLLMMELHREMSLPLFVCDAIIACEKLSFIHSLKQALHIRAAFSVLCHCRSV